jgi:hypothetical protein
VWLLTAVGCSEFFLDPAEPDEPAPARIAVTEQFVQAPLPKADLLLVIDNTSSMEQEQAALAEQLASILTELDDLGVGWHLGVVTMDLAGPEAGWLRGSPWVLTPDTPDRDARFAEMTAVGTEGGGPEAGLAAALEALDLSDPGEPNAGFRRPDALLHVVFVSDADDQSEGWLGEAPDSVFLSRLAAEVDQTGLPARASGVVGPPPLGCTSVNGEAQAAERYDAVAAGAGGVTVSICSPDLELVVGQLSEASIGWQSEFVLRSAPLEGSVAVEVDGQPAEGWTVLSDPPRVVFDAPPPPAAVLDVRYLVLLDGEGR